MKFHDSCFTEKYAPSGENKADWISRLSTFISNARDTACLEKVTRSGDRTGVGDAWEMGGFDGIYLSNFRQGAIVSIDFSERAGHEVVAK